MPALVEYNPCYDFVNQVWAYTGVDSNGNYWACTSLGAPWTQIATPQPLLAVAVQFQPSVMSSVMSL